MEGRKALKNKRYWTRREVLILMLLLATGCVPEFAKPELISPNADSQRILNSQPLDVDRWGGSSSTGFFKPSKSGDPDFDYVMYIRAIGSNPVPEATLFYRAVDGVACHEAAARNLEVEYSDLQIHSHRIFSANDPSVWIAELTSDIQTGIIPSNSVVSLIRQTADDSNRYFHFHGTNYQRSHSFYNVDGGLVRQVSEMNHSELEGPITLVTEMYKHFRFDGYVVLVSRE